MHASRSIPVAEFRRCLNGLGFPAKRGESAWIFHHRTEGLLVFRLYGDEEAVAERDLASARTFLDMRGLLEAKDFDAFIREAGTPARHRTSGFRRSNRRRGQ